MGEKPLGVDEAPRQTPTAGGASARNDGPDFPWDRASDEAASAPPLGSAVAGTSEPVSGDVNVEDDGR